ncbi:MAG TPA: diguanylate cyclase [Pirellulales bacterium]|nr:diguanylate cyclase [Pirellulales bacterium]
MLNQITLGEAYRTAPSSRLDERTFENQLIEARLGVAGGLFRALRCKHPATAAHSLRVALKCSAWSAQRGADETDHDALEVAALLHDVGKISVPDALLVGHSSLTGQDAATLSSHWTVGLELLQSSGAPAAVRQIVAAASAWYDGSRSHAGQAGAALPLGARMLAIVDAHDAMISTDVCEESFSPEQALLELDRLAGTRFDPKLVEEFLEVHRLDQVDLARSVAQRWLRGPGPEAIHATWRTREATAPAPNDLLELFQRRLVANVFDAVVFLDGGLKIIHWNRGAERLTGLSELVARGARWRPSLLELADEYGEMVFDDDCPVAHALHAGVQWLRRLSIRGQGGRRLAVDMHAVPVPAHGGVTKGVALLLHDVSSELSLEARCENLHEKAIQDPLTRLANRAELDRAHAELILAHQESQTPYSLIICDIDHFKRVNDSHGHPAGDEVIQSFARLLKSASRRGDLAARYGGEEFVLLCSGCDHVTAARRAEELRHSFSELPQHALGGKSVSASFGVTESLPGDTAETMLRRADRALMSAKRTGRNRVGQLGNHDPLETAPDGPGAIRRQTPKWSCERHLISEATIEMCLERLRGFVADHDAWMECVEGCNVRLRIGAEGGWILRRVLNRPPALLVQVRFKDIRRELNERTPDRVPSTTRTRIHLVITPQRPGDRRREELERRAVTAVADLRSYLMATDAPSPGWEISGE